MNRPSPRRRAPAAFRYPRAYTTQLRMERLEDRTVPTSGPLHYWADGEQIELSVVSEEYAVRVDGPDAESQLAQLTGAGGRFAGYEVGDSLLPGVFLLGLGEEGQPPPDGATAPADGVAWATPAFRVTKTGQEVVILDEVVVALNPGVEPGEVFGPKATAFRPLLGTPDQFVVTLAEGGAAALNYANALSEDERVAWAAPNMFRHMQKMFIPNDPLFATQWHLNNTGSQLPDALAGADVRAVGAWDIGTGAGVTIAVVDDGMERTHPDLAPNIFVNPGEVAGNNIDDDGNGYIDDVSGWSFVTNSPNPSVTVNDEHATSVAGIAAARGNNLLGVTGAAFNARIMPLQMFNGPSYVGDAGAASAIYYAAGRTANGLGTWNAAQVINCSWGGGSPSSVLTAAFTYASNTARGGKGVATFISSGNGYSSAVSYPANLSATLPSVMAVGATNQRDLRSEYSNFGSALDFVTPSSDVDSPVTGGTTTTDRTGSLGYNPAGDYTNNTVANGFGGTSSASPLAAGIGALVLSVDPSLSAAQVRQILRNTADKVGPIAYNASGFNTQYGYGRLNAQRALQSLGLSVVSTTPAVGSTVTLPPISYTVNFSHPYQAGTIQASDFEVNGIPADGFVLTDADTVTFLYLSSPVTSQGVQTMAMDAGAVLRSGDGNALLPFSGSFRFDAAPLSVTATSPPSGGVFTLPAPFTYVVNFNEDIAAASVGLDDLTVSTGTVLSAAKTGFGQATYTIGGITSEGTLTITVGAGRLTDAFGSPNAAGVTTTHPVDIGTVALPPAAARTPLGSLVYETGAAGVIDPSGDADSFTLLADPGQTLTVLVQPPSGSLYGGNGNGSANSGALVALNPATAQGVIVGNTLAPAGLTGLVYSQAAGVFFGSTIDGAFTSSNLVRVNPDTGAATLVAPIIDAATGQGISIGDLALQPGTGVLYGIRSNADGTGQGGRLYRISTTTGLATLVGNTGAGNGGGLAFAPDGTLYHANSQLSRLDPNTAARTILFSLPTFFDGLTVRSDGLLFAAQGGSGTAIYTINTANGAATLVGNSNVGSPSDLDFRVTSLQPVIELRDGFGALVGLAGAAAPGQPALLQTFATGPGGNYTITVRGAAGTIGAYSLQAVLNAAAEAEGNGGPSNNTLAGAQSLNAAFVPLGPAQRAAVLGRLDGSAGVPDLYSFTAAPGERVSLVVEDLAGGAAEVDLLDAAGNLIASAVAGPNNADRVLNNVALPAGGTYFARVRGSAAGASTYNLVVVRNAAFDAEPNDPAASARDITRVGGALGYVAAPAPGGDDFETGNLARLPWVTSGNAPWFVSTQAANTGTFGARSGAINHSQSSTLSVTLPTQAGNVSFARRVSSEGGFDFLQFRIDGVVVGSWSGEVPYSTVSFPVSAGTHTFSWTYSKDGSVVVGLDAAFIDNVVLPINPSGPDDWYAVQANAGDVLVFLSGTPADGAGQFVNTLNPALAVFDTTGTTLLASGVVQPDGRNEQVVFPVPSTGRYLLRVSGQGGTSGEYFVYSAGATGTDPAFSATTTVPANGSRTRVIPTTATVNFDDAILVASAQGPDLRIDGQPGTGVTVVDGDTLRFNLPAAVPTFFQWSSAVGGNNHWYGLTALPGTWQQTRAAALALGGELASVTSLAENQFLMNTFAVGINASRKSFWLGLTDEVIEGTFRWTNGDPFVFSNWANGEPNNFNGNEDYGMLNATRFGGALGSWNDSNATGPLYGIVELNGPPPAGWNPTEGFHTLSIPFGALADVQGTPVNAFTSTFFLDMTAPRITQQSFQFDQVYAPGTLTYDIFFSEAMLTTNLSTDDFALRGVLRGNVLYTPSSFGYLSPTQLRLVYANLPEDQYSFQLFSGDGRFEDAVGWNLEGEHFFPPVPPSATGDGVEGGDFVNGQFYLDFEPNTMAPTALAPSGGLAYQAPTVTNRAISHNTVFFAANPDVDSFLVHADAGQTLSVFVDTTTTGLQPRVEVVGPSGGVISTTTAAGLGADVVVQTVPLDAGGTYTVRVSGAGGTRGAYTLRTTLNAALEGESNSGSANNTVATAQSIDGSFVALASDARRGAVIGTTDNSTSYSVAAVAPSFTDISATGTRSTATGDDSAQTLSAAQLAGFSFPFFGVNNTSVSFSTNGLITFGGATTSFSNTDLSTSPSLATIAVLWDDLFNSNSGATGIFWQVINGGQQLVIQWNNVTQLGGINPFSFQAILSADGSIRFNYDSRVTTANVVASATVGIKAAGTANTPRTLISFNQAQGALVGPNLSTRLTPPVATPDYYSFSAAAGETVSLAAGGLAAGNIDVQLIAPDGTTVLASGVAGQTNLAEAIQNYAISDGGTYYARVSGGSNVPYNLVVTRNAAFDAEVNNTPAAAQAIGASRGALGAITVPSATTLNATDSGWITSAGEHASTNNNYFVGQAGPGFRNYANFTLSSALPTIVGAELRLFNPGTAPGIPGGYISPDATEAYELFDVSATPAALDATRAPGNAAGIAIYDDLGSGVNLGSRVVSAADNGTSVSIPLNATAVAALNAARGTNFALGGKLTSLAGTDEQSMFAFTTGAAGTVQLVLHTAAESDWYSVTLDGDQTSLRVETRTPADGIAQFANQLNPRVEVYDASGVVLLGAGSPLADGRNEAVTVAGLTPGGTYKVRVAAETSTLGEYFLFVNDVPVARDDSATTDEDTPVTIDVLANDSDYDGALDPGSIAIVSPPAHGTAVVIGGQVRYTPDLDYFGADSFTYTVSDDDGTASNVATVSITVAAVNDAPTASPTPAAQSVHYSDPIDPVTVAAEDVDTSGTNLTVATSYTFNGGAAVSGLPNGLALVLASTTDGGPFPGGAAGGRSWTISGIADVAPGTYVVTAVVSDNHPTDPETATTQFTITVEKENAAATYTGAQFVSTSTATSSTATITLAATIRDITAVLGDPTYDPNAGDIRNATVSFVNRATGLVIASNVPLGLIDPSDAKVATAVYEWAVDIGSADSADFHVGIVVNGRYTRDSAEDDVLITVAKPLDSFVTGGGHLVLTDSAGLKAGDDGSKANVSFGVKFNKSGTNLQGRLNLMVRRTEADGVVHTYQVKGNNMNSLAIRPATATDPAAATITGRANITDVTDPLNPVTVESNATIQLVMTDAGEGSSAPDTIGVTVWNRSGGMWFSSHWDGAQTVEQELRGGNLQVHPAGLAAGTTSGAAAAPISPADAQSLVARVLELWREAGASPEDLAAAAGASVVVTDLAGNMLGAATPGTVYIDADAAGAGWFVDPTPADDSEFATPGDQGEQGRMDLLSVLAHEFGHLLGHDHVEEGVMSEALATGVRVLPEDDHDHAAEEDLPFAEPFEGEAAVAPPSAGLPGASVGAAFLWLAPESVGTPELGAPAPAEAGQRTDAAAGTTTPERIAEATADGVPALPPDAAEVAEPIWVGLDPLLDQEGE